MKRQLLAGLLLAAAALAVGLAGCEKDKPTVAKPNQRPFVEITGGAAQHQSDDYKVEFYWFGYDPDGSIRHFELSVDDATFAEHDATSEFSRSLRFRADSLATQRSEYGDFHRWHTFYVRAVDNRGAVSDAAQRTFNAFTIAPFTEFRAPAGGRTSQFATTVRFKWAGQDDDSSAPDRKPVGYRYKLVKVDNVLTDWDNGKIADSLGVLNLDGSVDPRRAGLNVAWPDSIRSNPAVSDSIRREWIQIRSSSIAGMVERWNPVRNAWETVRGAVDQHRFENLEAGGYAFTVRAVDEAGAVEPVYIRNLGEDSPGNVFIFEALSSIPTSPTLVLFESSLGSFSFPRNGNSVDWEVAADKDLRFGWRGDANFYGGEIQAYNYGLDIPDPSSETQKPGGNGGWIGWGGWTANLAPIRLPAADDGIVHYFYVKVRDTSGKTQLGIARLKVVAFPFDKKILIIDDFSNFQGNPTDSQQDNYLDRVLRGRFAYADSQLIKWTNGPGISPLPVEPPAPPTLAELSRYELLIIYHLESGTNPGLYSVLGNLTSADNPTNPAHNPKRRALATYVSAGGKVWCWGVETAGGLQGDNYTYPKEPESQAGYETPDPAIFDRNSFLYSFLQIRRGVIWTVRNSSDNNVFFGATATSEAAARNYPNLEIDRARFPNTEKGLTGAETIHGARLIVAGLDTLYSYAAKRTASPYHGRPTALFYRSPSGIRGEMAYFGFYYYFLKEEQVLAMCNAVFADLFDSD